MADSYEATDEQMTTLLIGFDSAWTAKNSVGLVGVLRSDSGTNSELGPLGIVHYTQAQEDILDWQAELTPSATIVLLDQPTILRVRSPDIVCVVNGRYVGIECKAPKGKRRDNQKEFKDSLRRRAGSMFSRAS
jgi:hypothetical protein